MMREAVGCPICGREQPVVPRHPDYLCRDCMGRAATADGRTLRFYNTSLSGGFVAKYADEAHLDGIVVQPHPEENPREARR